jgi:catechol 2,3-dioxygenase-like lactoylglutathione lyase family enzyme
VFDHVEINVSDMDVSRRFFEAALAPLGYETSVESPELVDMQAAGRNDFGLVRRDPVGPTVHLGFEAPDRAAVDAFHDAALAAGGKDNGAPGLRPEYGDNYYAAFVTGPTGITSRPSQNAPYEPFFDGPLVVQTATRLSRHRADLKLHS